MSEFNAIDGYIEVSEVLIKGDKKNPNIIYIEASNQVQDSQDDIVLKKALDDQVNNYLKKGVLSWNHMHKVKKDPSYIIGEPLDVKFTKDSRTLVKGKIYPSNPYGKSVLNMVKDGTTRLGASIGGYIVKREKTYMPVLQKAVNAIVKIIWDETAITHEPINDNTRGKVSVVPFTEFAKSFITDDNIREELIQKALSVGYGTDSSQFQGGRSLQPESLAGSRSQKKLVDAFSIVLKSIKNKEIKNYKDMEKMLQSSGLQNFAPTIAMTISDSMSKLQHL